MYGKASRATASRSATTRRSSPCWKESSHGETRGRGGSSLEAYRRGARLDAWEEHVRLDLWRQVIADADWDVLGETCRSRATRESAALGRDFIWRFPPATSPSVVPGPDGACHTCRGCSLEAANGPWLRLVFTFSKTGAAAFISHLDLMTVFERAVARAGYSARFTEGFNPKPRLEFANPLSLGLSSQEEVAGIDLHDFDSAERFVARMNGSLPEGLRVLARRSRRRCRFGPTALAHVPVLGGGLRGDRQGRAEKCDAAPRVRAFDQEDAAGRGHVGNAHCHAHLDMGHRARPAARRLFRRTLCATRGGFCIAGGGFCIAGGGFCIAGGGFCIAGGGFCIAGGGFCIAGGGFFCLDLIPERVHPIKPCLAGVAPSAESLRSTSRKRRSNFTFVR